MKLRSKTDKIKVLVIGENFSILNTWSSGNPVGPLRKIHKKKRLDLVFPRIAETGYFQDPGVCIYISQRATA